jgi:dihydrofolate reductase
MGVTIIVACDPNKVIGKQNQLPWRLPEDLRLFRQRTLGHVVVMGRKTWQSIPKRPLDGRMNVVVSRTMYEPPTAYGIGPYFFDSLSWALTNSKKMWHDKEIFVIGGAEIYKQAIDNNLADRIILSEVNEAHEGDVYFPKLDSRWIETKREKNKGFDVVYLTNSGYLV